MKEERMLRFHRRLVLGLGLGLGLGLEAGTLAAATKLWLAIKQNTAAAIPALLNDICDRVIPATSTPGALAAGVPEFVLRALSVGIAGAKGDEMDRLTADLGQDYMNSADARRQQMLIKHDAAAFVTKPPRGTWPVIKKLIILGYYTSEIGGSRELRYELDPGGFKPDLLYKPGDPAWSNDWFAVAP